MGAFCTPLEAPNSHVMQTIEFYPFVAFPIVSCVGLLLGLNKYRYKHMVHNHEKHFNPDFPEMSRSKTVVGHNLALVPCNWLTLSGLIVTFRCASFSVIDSTGRPG